MSYIAQANICHENLDIKKGQVISKEVYNSLPEKFKVKFLSGKVSAVPSGFNQVIGDSPEEKLQRERLTRDEKVLEKPFNKKSGKKVKTKKRTKNKTNSI